VRFHDQKPLVLRSLNKLEEKLDPQVFFRANRKHIINLRWVEGIEPWFNNGLMVKLRSTDRNGQPEKIEVSRRQSARFKELLSL
ncbi:MAG: LytTR family DNA-binding domain-containing protein, partial [Flavobacteriales bacterium]|jgi:two-component system LytT family response regulator|nr:LytTR family DNA-binding domain-containing protein [Flavobacteriales bacterium]